MPYDEDLAHRVRTALEGQDGFSEKKMFGGLAFLDRGNMCVGVVGEELMVRVGPEAYEETLSQPHARTMDFTGKPLTGFVFVSYEGFESQEALDGWIESGLRFTRTLPAK